MKSFEIQTDNPEIIEAFRKLAGVLKINFIEKKVLDQHSNLQNDPYFNNPDVVQGIIRGVEDSQEGRIFKLSKEERDKLFDL